MISGSLVCSYCLGTNRLLLEFERYCEYKETLLLMDGVNTALENCASFSVQRPFPVIGDLKLLAFDGQGNQQRCLAVAGLENKVFV
jgi:hypothetical protein